MVAKSFAPIIAGSGGVLLEAPDTLPESGVLALAVNAAGKMSAVEFPETTRATLGLATTDSPTFAGGTFNTGTITTSQPLSLSQTWNNAATTFTGLQVNATDTASNAASLLMDLQVGGVSRCRITKNGFLRFSTAGLYDQPINIGGAYIRNDGAITATTFAIETGRQFYVNSSFLRLGDTQSLQWSSSTAIPNAGDLILARDAANTLAQRNGTTGQKSRLYKTYTSATSGEWLEFDAATDASNFDIAASIGSAGGSARGIRIGGKDAAGTFSPWLSFLTSGSQLWHGGVVYFGSVTSGASMFGGTNVLFNLATNGSFLIRNNANTPIITVTNNTGDATFSGTINPRTGTAAAGTAPIKLTAGTNLTTPEAGAIEYDGTSLYFTDSGGTRRQLAVV